MGAAVTGMGQTQTSCYDTPDLVIINALIVDHWGIVNGCGLKLHEDWGTTPAAIDNCLSVAGRYNLQVAIHTDTLNESGFVEDTIGAFKGRIMHTYHCFFCLPAAPPMRTMTPC